VIPLLRCTSMIRTWQPTHMCVYALCTKCTTEEPIKSRFTCELLPTDQSQRRILHRRDVSATILNRVNGVKCERNVECAFITEIRRKCCGFVLIVIKLPTDIKKTRCTLQNIRWYSLLNFIGMLTSMGKMRGMIFQIIEWTREWNLMANLQDKKGRKTT